MTDEQFAAMHRLLAEYHRRLAKDHVYRRRVTKPSVVFGGAPMDARSRGCRKPIASNRF